MRKLYIHVILLVLASIFNVFFYKIAWPAFIPVLIMPYFVFSFSIPIQRNINLPAGVAICIGLLLWTWMHFWLSMSVISLGWPAIFLALTLLWALTYKKLNINHFKEAFSSQESMIFTGIFFLFLFFYSFFPSLFAGEKLMDMSLLGFVQKTSVLPLEDPWFPGEKINYYYFGYYLFGSISRLLFIPIETSYAVSMAILPAILFLGFFNLMGLYLDKTKSLMATSLFLFSANFQVILQTFQFKGRTFGTFWNQTRFLKGGLFAEYPIWSFLWGDLHPHVMSMVFIPAFIYLALRYLKNEIPKWNLYLLGLILASFLAMNLWDFILFFSLFAFMLVKKNSSIFDKLYTKIFILFFACIISIAFVSTYGKVGGEFLSYAKINNDFYHWFKAFGIWWMFLPLAFYKKSQKSLWSLMGMLPILLYGILLYRGIKVHWSPYLFSTLALFFLGRKEKNNRNMILIFSLLTLVIVESFTLMDRYNTIFKFFNGLYFLFAFVGLTYLFSEEGDKVKYKGYALMSVFMLCFGFTFACRYSSSYTRKSGNHTDPAKYLLQKRFGDYDLVKWFRMKIIGLPIVLEAYGESFDYETQRITSGAALPSYMGWGNHVRLRGHKKYAMLRRKRNVKRIYNSVDAKETHELLLKEKIKLIVIGELERQRYTEKGLAKFHDNRSYFPLVFRRNGMTVYGVRMSNYMDYLKVEKAE